MSEILRQIWTPQMQMVFTIIALLIICLYALSIVWISRDARLRGIAPMKWMIIGLVPGAGIIAYLLLRPPMLAMDRDEQELEVALKQRELMKYGECAQCGYPVKEDYVLCPNCQTQLRNLCSNCNKPLEPSWPVCPYCTAPVAGANAVNANAVLKPAKRRSTTVSSHSAHSLSENPRNAQTSISQSQSDPTTDVPSQSLASSSESQRPSKRPTTRTSK